MSSPRQDGELDCTSPGVGLCYPTAVLFALLAQNPVLQGKARNVGPQEVREQHSIRLAREEGGRTFHCTGSLFTASAMTRLHNIAEAQQAAELHRT